MLRTYAQYLGLKPDRVLSVYAEHGEDVAPPEPPGKLGRVERGLAASRIRDNQKFLLVAAAVVLVALIGFGLVSRDGAPPAAAIVDAVVRAGVRGELALAGRRRRRHRHGAGRGHRRDRRGGAAPTALRPGESMSLMAADELSAVGRRRRRDPADRRRA